tara:strand:+ start:11862 stop:12749 length:888 start_codon:yes stop_codon:yes gene_type:complete
MGYIGSRPANAYTTFSKQDLTGTTCSAGASVTLNNSATTASDIRLVINNVIQEPDTSYTCSGNQLTILNTPVVASDDWYVVFLSKALQSVNPPDNSVGSAQIASSAVDLTSNKVTGVLPVANGGSALVKLYTETIGSVATYDTINSTYINTSYDKYKIYYYLKPASDNADLRMRFYVGGSIIDASNTYSYETASMNGESQSNEGVDHMQVNYEGIGNDTGEGISGFMELQNVNNTLFACGYTGMASMYRNSTHYHMWMGGIFKSANYASAVNGLRLYMSSGNIAEGTIQVYGVAE